MSRQQQVEKKTDPIADGIEHGFDAAHRVADSVVGSLGLKPVDSVIHGTARGIKNWLCDEHPQKPACNDDKDEPSQRNGGGNNINNKGNDNINNSMLNGTGGNTANGNINVGK